MNWTHSQHWIKLLGDPYSKSGISSLSDVHLSCRIPTEIQSWENAAWIAGRSSKTRQTFGQPHLELEWRKSHGLLQRQYYFINVWPAFFFDASDDISDELYKGLIPDMFRKHRLFAWVLSPLPSLQHLWNNLLLSAQPGMDHLSTLRHGEWGF